MLSQHFCAILDVAVSLAPVDPVESVSQTVNKLFSDGSLFHVWISAMSSLGSMEYGILKGGMACQKCFILAFFAAQLIV